MFKLRTTENDRIAKEGYPFILGAVAAAFALRPKSRWLCRGSLLFGAFSAFFFRNPRREPPEAEDAIISPADGVVIAKDRAFERYFLNKEVDRISIFMSLFDVHVNRSPVTGRVLDTHYNPGKYLPAYKEKASLDNEQNAILMEDKKGRRIVVVQIAGLVARRIACYKEPDDSVRAGEIIGLIRFGSRVDVYAETGITYFVDLKEKVKAGQTILGAINEKQT